MVFWQLTIDANDPPRLARFWAVALGYQPTPPEKPETTWNVHYLDRLGGDDAYEDRIFDPEGLRPPIWFQWVPESKAGKNRLHLDLYPTARDNALTLAERMTIVDATVDGLVTLGATVRSRTTEDDEEGAYYFVTLADPEGNEFCVS